MKRHPSGKELAEINSVVSFLYYRLTSTENILSAALSQELVTR